MIRIQTIFSVPSFSLVAQSMSKAARPVAFSLLIILLVYLPLMALEGVEGRMFKPMAMTVALALGGALLFSLTAFPALAALENKDPKKAAALRAMVEYCLTDGQKASAAMGYVPLPEPVVAAVRKASASIQ